MTELMVLVPSRGRPEAVREMHTAFIETCTADTALVFVVDNDDPRFDAYLREGKKIWGDDARDSGASLDIIYHYPEDWGRGMVAALNHAAMNKIVRWWLATGTPPPYAVGFMGDDHRPRTEGWDARYLEELQGGALFVYGDDLLQGEAIPTQVAMRSSVVQTLGYMAPAGFQHLCIDLVWKDWGLGTGRLKYLSDVVVEHMHPANGKAALDEGYERVNNVEVTTKDAARYYAWKASELAGELPKLREIV